MADETSFPTTTPAAPVKAGWKTSEAWLSAAATILSLLYAMGLLGSHQGVADKIAALLAAALIAAGYTVTRGKVKSA